MQGPELLDLTREDVPRPASPFAVAVAAFAAVSPLLITIAPQSPGDPADPTFVAAALLTCAILAVALGGGRRPDRPWATVVGPALAYLVVVALLRHATGGGTTLLIWAVALPIVWLALYGRRRDLAAGLIGVALVYGAPVVLVGGPDYAPEVWPRAILAWLIVAAVGWTVRQYTEAIGERVALTRSILQSAQHAFVSFDEAGTITGWNHQAELLFGYSEEEAIGRSALATLVPSRYREVAQRDLERFLAGDEPRLLGTRRELHALRRDGRQVAVEMTTSVVLTSRGHIFNAFLHDISGRRHSEQRLRTSARTMEAIAAATHALSRSTDPGDARKAICDAAREVAGAPLAFLIEPRYVDGFVVTASSGLELPGGEMRIPELAGTAEAYLSGRPFFVADAPASAIVSQRLVTHAGVKSALFHPVHHAGEPIGFLSIAWRERLSEPPEAVNDAMTLLAMHAAAAIDRSNLLLRLGALARTDPLTGLPNRRDWDEVLPRELERALRDERTLSVAMLDMDHFSAYNAAHGHPGGDRLLKACGAAWRTVLRSGDMLARCGGEEFGVILPNADRQEAMTIIQRVRAATPEGETCSAGIAIWDGSESAAELVTRADEALYAAKQAGRDRTYAAVSPAEVTQRVSTRRG